jgi:zeaxanthin glucosyltransferase
MKTSRVEQNAGKDAVQFTLRKMLVQTESILKSLPAITQANGVDALVIDTFQFYAELGAMQLGMPYIHVSAGLHRDYSGHTPPSHYDWPHQTTPAALARNREAVAKFAKMLGGCAAGVRTYVESVGLKIDWDDLSPTISPLALITQVPRAFDLESFSLAIAVPPHRSIP